MIWKVLMQKYCYYIALLLSASALYAQAPKIQLVDYALGDYFYPYVDKSEQNKGCLSQYITKAFAEKGITVKEVDWLPWNTALKSLNWESKVPRVSFPWSKTEEREKYYLYSEPLYTKSMYIWVTTKKSNIYKKLTDLKDQKICVPQGYGIYGKLEEMLQNKQVKRVTPLTMQDCFNYLQQHKVAAVYAGDDGVKAGQNAIKTSDDGSKKNTQKTAKTNVFKRAFTANKKTHYLVAGKKHPDAQKLIEAFNDGVKKLKDKGQPLDIQALCFAANQ